MNALVKAALFLLAVVVAFLLGLSRAPEGEVEVRYDTTFVELPPRTVYLPPPDGVLVRRPEEIVRLDTVWQTRIDTVLAECASGEIAVRSYASTFSDTLLRGTLYTDVFGILLDQRLEYSVTVPIIEKTVYRSPVRGLAGVEGSYDGNPSVSALVGIRFPRYSFIARGNPFTGEVGLGVLRTF